MNPLASLLLSLTLFSQNSPPAPQPPQRQAAPRQQVAPRDLRGTSDSPVVVRVIPLPISKQDSADAQREAKRKADTDAWIVRLTGLLTIIAAMQLVLFSWQLRQMHASVKDATLAAQAATVSAEAAQRSATLTEAALTLSKDTANRQLRAYLLVKRAKMGLVVVDKNPVARITLINTGQTPAYKLRPAGAFEFAAFPRQEPWTIPPSGPRVGRGPLGAGRSFTMLMTFPYRMPREALTDFQAGTTAFFSFGSIEYEDVFGAVHTTHFRFEYDRNSARGENMQMSICRDGNEAD